MSPTNARPEGPRRAVSDRSHTKQRLVDEMVLMLRESEIEGIHASDLARRAGVAIPTVYYNFPSLDAVIAEATVEMLRRFLEPFLASLERMEDALAGDDNDEFVAGTEELLARSWMRETNDEVHRLAPLVANFRRIAPEDTRLRSVQAEVVQDFITAMRHAQGRGWIHAEDNVTAFVVVHWTCVLGQAVFYHPAFGALTAVDFSSGVGRLRYQTGLASDLRAMPVSVPVTDEESAVII